MADNHGGDVDINDLAEYEESDEEVLNENNADEKKNISAKDTHVAMHSSGFREFLLKPELERVIGDCGFEHPSEVQNECIPQAILGTDVICQAKSGMGKTAVFVLAILQQIENNPTGITTLVLCNTRELAYQICDEFDRFTKYLPNVKTAVIYGGIPVNVHKELIRDKQPNIIIGTPGRVLQLATEKSLSLKNIKHFILDECDTMLESLDMRKDVQKIFKLIPSDKQVMMFSATLSDTIRPVCKKFMSNPLEIYINDGSKLTLHGLQQYYVSLKEEAKNKKLVDLLDALDFNQAVIFVKSVARAAALDKILQDIGFPSICIHRDLTQTERIERYRKFKYFESRIMVATNIFGRGIDVERVNVVINYDMAECAETYLHRVGRAGRFGTKGLAISFITEGDKENKEVLDQVQSKFVVSIKELPPKIDPSTYMSGEDDTSLLVIIVDCNSFYWGNRTRLLRHNESSSSSSTSKQSLIPFHTFLEHLMLFINAYLLLNQENQVAVICSKVGESHFIYPNPLDQIDFQTTSIQETIIKKLESLDLSTASKDRNDDISSSFSGAMSLSLCYVSSQYISVMNCIFSSQKQTIPVDSCILSQSDSTFLQQASHLTNGIYLKPQKQDNLIQYLLTTFLIDTQSRKILNTPTLKSIDYRASCFCHKKIVDIGFGSSP
eukprot:gene9132-11189_t